MFDMGPLRQLMNHFWTHLKNYLNTEKQKSLHDLPNVAHIQTENIL